MNDPHSHTSTAVVVGGGPAGLIAAAKLAEAGIATTLLEAGSALGGRAASKRQGGFDLNQGAHALYVGGPGMRQLRSLGIDPERWNPVSHRSVFLRDGHARRSPGAIVAVTRWIGSVLRGATGAAVAGDIDAIRSVLAADAILYSDGGGVVVAARKPIYGADKIARFIVGVLRKPAFATDIEYTMVRVNGDFGVRMVSPSAGFVAITAVQAQEDELVAVRIFSNPERFA